MNTDEIIDKLKFAIEMCCDGGISPFKTEEINEMNEWLNAHKTPEHGHYVLDPSEKPRFKIGDILAYHFCSTDGEGEGFYGEITKIEWDWNYCDWIYTFKDKTNDDYDASEESVMNDECYKVSKEYYKKHC
jgi:hypothetical protein